MYEKAIDKIRDEMAATKNNAIEMLGELLTAALRNHRDYAQAIMAEGKTVKGAYEAMRNVARKEKRECIGPSEALKIALEYYGIKTTAAEALAIIMGGQEAPAEQSHDDSLDLDALMG